MPPNMVTVDDLLSRRNALESMSLTNDVRVSMDAGSKLKEKMDKKRKSIFARYFTVGLKGKNK